MLIENAALERQDITWWQALSSHAIEDLLRHHESLPLFPDPAADGNGLQQVLPDIGADEQFQTALPVYDLAVKAGSWGSEVEPEVVGWARVPRRPLEADMFVARVVGHSMEPGIPDGAWGLFRSFPADGQPSPTSLDGRRVVARLTSKSDPETGKYTLKRWKVTKVTGDQIQEVTLRPDNKAVKPLLVTTDDGEVRVVAEYLETVG
jgi:SOS-response transcriptional repressor LexA